MKATTVHAPWRRSRSEWGAGFGALFGGEKGPGLFREKEWQTITIASYTERIVPLIHGMVSMRPELQVMLDRAPPHKAALTIAEFVERNLSLIEWPPYSPDLNPIVVFIRSSNLLELALHDFEGYAQEKIHRRSDSSTLW
ncbi:hypothetical protein K3495_g10376 [Podosphaera aphanis]|nr:hypothetical protein K3495_g10376 [Podosphaera aphanis]